MRRTIIPVHFTAERRVVVAVLPGPVKAPCRHNTGGIWLTRERKWKCDRCDFIYPKP